MTVGGRIAFLRQRLGMSQRVFGERVGRSVGYINRLENGKAEVNSVVVSAICSAFGVDEDWLLTGEGKLEVESTGDRFRRARKVRDYTQEELAEEIGCSRNTVGMIERGTVRPGDGIVDAFCDCLWIDKGWLLTGQGSMERMELTPVYELLKRDPDVRRHIRNYIDHLDNPYGDEEPEVQEEARTTIAYVVNDMDAARKFFAQYNIPYQEEETEAGIRVRVKAPRMIDHERAQEVRNRIRKARIPNALCDHEYVFRDADDNTIVTYSPYDVEEVSQTWIEKTEFNFYGFGTTTFVVKC